LLVGLSRVYSSSSVFGSSSEAPVRDDNAVQQLL